MKPCSTEQEYLDQIIEPARRVCKRYGYLSSVLIAQSCLENGFAKKEYFDNPQVAVLVEKNNGVGIKRFLLNPSWVDIGLSVWDGRYISKDTPEEYGGQKVIIKDDFRVYDCMEQSFADFLCFLTYASNYGAGGAPKYGQEVLSIKDPETLIREVSRRGYATDSRYADSVMRIINKHNLTQYDNLDGVEPTKYYPKQDTGIKINQNPNFGTHNTSVRSGKIEFICIHYVGATGDAKANIDYYNQPSTTEASADFYVGFKGDIWQYNPDPTKRYCWAVGGGRQSSQGGSFYGICKNANSVSIEMCVHNSSTRPGSSEWWPNSPTWYFDDATIASAVKLTKYLMQKYGIPSNHVIRHFDVNGKYCPGVYGWNYGSGSEEAWEAFKTAVDGEPTPQPEPVKYYRVRKAWNDPDSQIGAYTVLENAKEACPAGYSVFDEDGNVVYSVPEPTPEPPTGSTLYRVQVGGRVKSQAAAEKRVARVKKKTDLDSFIEPAGTAYRVICGSFASKENAEKRRCILEDAGFRVYIQTVKK